MRHASLRDPTCLPIAQRVLAISPKRFDRPALDFLSRDEIDALLDAPDTSTWRATATPCCSRCSTTAARASPKPPA
jgi:integrase